MVPKWYISFLVIVLAFTGICQNAVLPVSKSISESSDSYFIIKKDNLYGLGDSINWYNNTPIGDTLFHLGDYHFALRKPSGLYTIYDESFKSIYHRIKSLKEFGDFVLLEDSLGWKIFSKEDNEERKYFDSVRIHDQYVWLFKSGQQGILGSDWKIENIILPVYDKVGIYYDGILLINNGKLGWKGAVNIPVEFDHIYKERQDIMAAKNRRGTSYYSLTKPKKLLIEPTDSIVFYSEFYKRVRGHKQSIFNLDSNQIFGEISDYEIHPFSFDNFSRRHSYCVVTKDSACALFKNGKILTGFDYDNFLTENTIHPPFFKAVQNKKVGVINEIGEIQLKPLYTDIIDKRFDYYIVRVGNKLGLCLKGDSVLLPANYQSISFYNNSNYVSVSLDGNLFGLYNFINKQEVTLCKYNFFNIDSEFIIARKGELYDVYFKEQFKFYDLYDAQSNGTTAKGYKDGKIFIGSLRNNTWEEFSYEIPSYKIISDKNNPSYLKPFNYTDRIDLYDYSVGKWGHYSYNSQVWIDAPLMHCGDRPDGNWLLGFHQDTTIVWKGINFHSNKVLSPLQIAWQKKSVFHWMDVNSYSYPSDNERSTHLIISPICYTEPGKGKCFDNYKKSTINAVFKGRNHSIISDNGKIEIASQGDMSLSNYITQLSTNGSIHAQSILDYEKIINPNAFIRTNGASEHILQNGNRGRRHISVLNSFEWFDKKENNLLIFKIGNKYGLLSDSGEYVLKAKYESIQPLKLWGATILKVGIIAEGYKLYNPENNSFSKRINGVIDKRGELILIHLESGKQAILTINLDTLIKTYGLVKLIGDNDYAVIQSEHYTVYRDQTVLFNFIGDNIEKINNEHFLIHSNNGNCIFNYKGDTLFKSRKAIKYLSLGNHFLLDDGVEHTLYSKDDAIIYQFQKTPYLSNDNEDLIIKGENRVAVFRKNQIQKIEFTGKFVKVTKHYIVLDLGKYKRVYGIDGTLIQSKAKQVKVLNDDYISYQEGNKFYLVNVLTKEKKKIKSLNINLSKEGIDYEDMEENLQILTFKAKDTLSIVEYKGMYGLKSNDKMVLPYMYFKIEPLANKFLVQDNIEYKLFNSMTRKFISDDTFDTVYPYKGYLMLTKSREITYMNPYGGLTK